MACRVGKSRWAILLVPFGYYNEIETWWDLGAPRWVRLLSAQIARAPDCRSPCATDSVPVVSLDELVVSMLQDLLTKNLDCANVVRIRHVEELKGMLHINEDNLVECRSGWRVDRELPGAHRKSVPCRTRSTIFLPSV